MTREYTSFPELRTDLARELLKQPLEKVGEWQSTLQDSGLGVTREITNCIFRYRLPGSGSPTALADHMEPNLPWAEDHFLERVSGEPLNPPPSEAYWPFAQQGNEQHKHGEKFSHTYPERFWPKQAGDPNLRPVIAIGAADNRTFGMSHPDFKTRYTKHADHFGIRYPYGDLQDVVNLLARSPRTRQAFLPVWFPEDTGNREGVRVPCTLGYHFRLIGEELHITYLIRSCDFLRHWTDDCYMAARLVYWVLQRLDAMGEGWSDIKPGTLTFHAMSLHAFEGDTHTLKQMAERYPEGVYEQKGTTYDLRGLTA